MSTPQKFRAACYAIEGVNSFVTVIFFNYLYFFFRHQFGFSDKQNLALAALIGAIYTVTSWQAGRFAQRYGYFTALKLGFSVMAAGLAIGLPLHFAIGKIIFACVANIGMCFIWPTLEALVSEGAVAARAVGIYNITWAAANALAYFIGGTFIEKFGYDSIFYLPLAAVVLQLAAVFWLEKIHPPELAKAETISTPHDPNRPPPAKAKMFQRMAWLANPFAYIAINTLIAVIPGIAAKFHLSPMLAGFACSLWCFARFFTFIALWHWTKWHYRFRWLAAAFTILIVSFATILISPNLIVLVAAQIFFGGAIGLIYYSSLFYAMDASDTKGEHGGIHEAAIGIGNCVGPGIGAASLQLFPQYTHNGVIAVTILLLGGFGGLLAIWKTAK
ncbi:MAG TPA: MFS transporter [Verrucomicrobiae bacterium]|nr:MFS transporter [Verrucomicrobiae bacterium]